MKDFSSILRSVSMMWGFGHRVLHSVFVGVQARNSGPISNDDGSNADDDDILSTRYSFSIFAQSIASVQGKREKNEIFFRSKTTTQIYRMTDEHKLHVVVDIIIEVVLP